jgi:hypothetical protein
MVRCTIAFLLLLGATSAMSLPPERPDIAWADLAEHGLVVWQETENSSIAIAGAHINQSGYRTNGPDIIGGQYFPTGGYPRVASDGVGFFVVYEVDETFPCSSPGTAHRWIGGIWYEDGAQSGDPLVVTCASSAIEPIKISEGAAKDVAIAYDAELEKFLVVWVDLSIPFFQQIKGRFYDRSGVKGVPPEPDGDEFKISVDPIQPNVATTNPKFPAVAASGEGDFFVTWTDAESPEVTRTVDQDEDCYPNEQRIEKEGETDECAKLAAGVYFTRVTPACGPCRIGFAQGASNASFNRNEVIYFPSNGFPQWLVVFEAQNLTVVNTNLIGVVLVPDGGGFYQNAGLITVADSDSHNDRWPSLTVRTPGSSTHVSWSLAPITGGTVDHASIVINNTSGSTLSLSMISLSTSCDEDQARGAYDGTGEILFARKDTCSSSQEIMSAEKLNVGAYGVVDQISN